MVRFAETERLDRTAVATAAGAAAVVALGTLAGMPGPDAWLRWAGPFVIAAAAAAGFRGRVRSGLLGLLATAAGAIAWGYWLFADAVTGAALAALLAWDSVRTRPGATLKGWQVVASAVLGAVAWPAALRAIGAVAASALGAGEIPPVVVNGAAGAFAGLLVGLTSIPAFLEPGGDPVADALARVRPMLDGELRDLVLRIAEARGRALRMLERSRADARSRAETRRGLDGVALTAIEVCDRFGAVGRVLGRTTLTSVVERAAALRTQLEQATDAGVRRDLERAVASLDEQKAQLERLLQGRARLVARLESELASLEKAEMSLALLASGDAALSGVRLEAIGSGLGRQATELEAEGSALQEALTVAPAQAIRKIAAS